MHGYGLTFNPRDLPTYKETATVDLANEYAAAIKEIKQLRAVGP